MLYADGEMETHREKFDASHCVLLCSSFCWCGVGVVTYLVVLSVVYYAAPVYALVPYDESPWCRSQAKLEKWVCLQKQTPQGSPTLPATVRLATFVADA